MINTPKINAEQLPARIVYYHFRDSLEQFTGTLTAIEDTASGRRLHVVPDEHDGFALCPVWICWTGFISYLFDVPDCAEGSDTPETPCAEYDAWLDTLNTPSADDSRANQGFSDAEIIARLMAENSKLHEIVNDLKDRLYTAENAGKPVRTLGATATYNEVLKAWFS